MSPHPLFVEQKIFFLDTDTLVMDDREIGLLHEVHDALFRSLLERQHCRGSVSLDIVSFKEFVVHLPDKPLEGCLLDQKASGPLKAPDLAEGNSAGSPAKPLSTFCLAFVDLSAARPFVWSRRPVAKIFHLLDPVSHLVVVPQGGAGWRNDPWPLPPCRCTPPPCLVRCLFGPGHFVQLQ